jgi:hypothetical protein
VAVDKPQGLLLLHHLNTDGARAQVVTVKRASTTKLAASPTSITYGGRTTLTATVSPSNATGSVTFGYNGKALRTVKVSGGKAVLPVTGLPRGTASFTASYSGDASTASSRSGTVKVAVKGLTSRTSLSANVTTYRYGGRPVLTAQLTPSGATGTVTFREGSRVLGTSTVRSGKATLWAPVLSRGTHRVTATYSGSKAYNPSTSGSVTLTVR